MKQIPTTQSTGILAYIDRFTEKIENGIMSFGLLAISAIVFANVIARYFFGYSFAWSEELSRYIIVWVTFFGISSCARYDGHVSVDLLPNLLKGTAKRIQQIMVCLLSICLSIYMTFISVQFTLTQFEGGNTNNTQHDTTKKRSHKSGSSCYFRGMRGYISISKSSGFRRLPGTAIFL